MDRVLKGSTGTVSLLLTSDGETPVDADGSVTVAVVNDEGDTVQSGTATKTPATTGQYTYALQPDEGTADLDLLTITWACDIAAEAHTLTTRVEVVGGFHVDLATIRGTGTAALAAANFPTQSLVDGREWWENLAEDYCGRVFVPRYRRTTFRASRIVLLDAPLRSIRWATVDGVAVDTSTWTVHRDGLVTDTAISSGAEVVVGYEVGQDQAPARLADAARIAIRDHVARHAAGADRRLSRMDGQGGMERLSYAAPDRPTGIPEVDAALNNLRLPAIA